MTPPFTPHAVVELRQYTLHPGRRDDLVALFDREFVAPQEACGIAVLGQFRDLDAPDRFVWLRGFTSMAARADALTQFYDGPVWRAHRDAANATMIDSDDVLLLRPADAWPTPSIDAWQRDANTSPAGALVAIVVGCASTPSNALIAAIDAGFAPAITTTGASVAGRFVTEPARNTFPRLPVREGIHVAVWLLRTADVSACTQLADAIGALDLGRLASAAGNPIESIQLLRLAPTAASRF